MNLPSPSRKGAATLARVPAEVREALDRGLIESVNLTECLAVDFAALMRHALPDLPETTLEQLRNAATLGISRRMTFAAEVAWRHGGTDALARFAAARSDTLRGWAACMAMRQPADGFARRLEAIRPFADDAHFGVREWAWMALRPWILEDPDAAIAALVPWVSSPAPNLRRFASEATRPRGVWSAHIDLLKREPERGLPLLEPLRADPERYVQDSVANWLNDAGKTCPDWLRTLLARWRAESSSPATAYICRRAARSLGKH